MTRRQRLRALVAERRGLLVPGAYDAVSARLVEQAGFPAVYMTGFGVSAARLGLPDLGFAGLAEMVDHARNLASAVSIPVIADADTGYGNALQVRRTVQQYELAGVAGLHLEDQIAPKRCGHLAGKQLVPVEEFVGRIRAAVEARTDPDLLIIARTDAIAVTGFEAAVGRAEAAARAGADVLFVEAPTSEAEIEALPRRLDRPLLFNYAPSGRSPLLPFARLPQHPDACRAVRAQRCRLERPVERGMRPPDACREMRGTTVSPGDLQSGLDRYVQVLDGLEARRRGHTVTSDRLARDYLRRARSRRRALDTLLADEAHAPRGGSSPGVGVGAALVSQRPTARR